MAGSGMQHTSQARATQPSRATARSTTCAQGHATRAHTHTAAPAACRLTASLQRSSRRDGARPCSPCMRATPDDSNTDNADNAEMMAALDQCLELGLLGRSRDAASDDSASDDSASDESAIDDDAIGDDAIDVDAIDDIASGAASFDDSADSAGVYTGTASDEDSDTELGAKVFRQTYAAEPVGFDFGGRGLEAGSAAAGVSTSGGDTSVRDEIAELRSAVGSAFGESDLTARTLRRFSRDALFDDTLDDEDVDLLDDDEDELSDEEGGLGSLSSASDSDEAGPVDLATGAAEIQRQRAKGHNALKVCCYTCLRCKSVPSFMSRCCRCTCMVVESSCKICEY